MKKLAIAATISAGVLLFSGCSNSGDVIVKSKSGDITKEEFYTEMKDQIGANVLQQMMLAKILEDKFEVDDKEVDKEVKQMKDEMGDQFDLVLQQQGIKDEDQLREQIRISMLYEEAMFGDVKITDEELKEQFERMKTELKASHILVADEKEAKDIKKQLDEGADFKKLAKEHSTDGSAENGGDLGWFSTGDMVPEFEDQVYSMKKGEISEPVKSQFGYHIILLKDKRKKEEDIGNFEDNKDMIENDLKNKKVDTEAKLKELLEQAEIDVKDEQFKDLFNMDQQNAQG